MMFSESNKINYGVINVYKIDIFLNYIRVPQFIAYGYYHVLKSGSCHHETQHIHSMASFCDWLYLEPCKKNSTTSLIDAVFGSLSPSMAALCKSTALTEDMALMSLIGVSKLTNKLSPHGRERESWKYRNKTNHPSKH